MLNKLTLMTSSFVMALTLAVPQLSYGTNESQVEEKKSLQSSTKFTDLPLELLQMRIQQVEEKKSLQSSTKFTDLPLELLKMRILEKAIINGENPDKLSLENQDWSQDIKQEMQVGKTLWKVWSGVKSKKDEEIYKTFINGKLIFKPDSKSEKGMKEFPILDFANPFKGIFDLSECQLPEYAGIPASKYLRITTDPATFFKVDVEYEDQRVNILIAPHFLIENLTKRDEKHPFADIIKNWKKDKAPIGMFWRWCGDNKAGWHDDLIDSSLLDMSGKSLYRNWRCVFDRTAMVSLAHMDFSDFFHVHFSLQNEDY